MDEAETIVISCRINNLENFIVQILYRTLHDFFEGYFIVDLLHWWIIFIISFKKLELQGILIIIILASELVKKLLESFIYKFLLIIIYKENSFI